MTPLTFNHVVRQTFKAAQPLEALLIRRCNLQKLRDDNVSGVRQGCHWYKHPNVFACIAEVRFREWSQIWSLGAWWLERLKNRQRSRDATYRFNWRRQLRSLECRLGRGRTKCPRTKCPGQDVPDKMSLDKKGPGQNVPGQNVPGKKSQDKMSQDKMSQDKMSRTKCPWTNCPRTKCPRTQRP